MFFRIPHSCIVGCLAAWGATVLPASLSALADEVDIRVLQFGVGDVYRGGDEVGVQFEVTLSPSAGPGQSSAGWIQWEVPGPDGDIAEHGTGILLQPGTGSRTWITASLMPGLDPRDSWTVRVFRLESDGSRGTLLGSTRISPPVSGLLAPGQGLVGVIGVGTLGLQNLDRPSSPRGGVIHSAHEGTRIATRILVEDLPVHWEALSNFNALAWTSESPRSLGAGQAGALLEWLRRGGHLVIVLPEGEDTWGTGGHADHELHGVLPRNPPARDDTITLDSLRSIISLRGTPIDPTRKQFEGWVFGNVRSAALPEHPWQPLFCLEDGRIVVIQRAYGHGQITIVGIDLANRRFGSVRTVTGGTRQLPRADSFWNRVLGRRADTPSSSEVVALDEEGRLSTAYVHALDIGPGSLIAQWIGMSPAATIGFLVGFLLFIMYWLLAGPGGYYLLKQRRMEHHAWIAFTAVTILFAILAWVLVVATRTHTVIVRHLSILDQVAQPGIDPDQSEPQLQRLTSWFSVYLPGYGKREIGFETHDGYRHDPGARDLLVPWSSGGGLLARFPDVDRYAVNAALPSPRFSLPSRSTSTRLKATWLGSIPEKWGGLLYSDPEDPIHVESDAWGREALHGSIVSRLPGALRYIKVIWIKNTRMIPPPSPREETQPLQLVSTADSGRMLNTGSFWAFPADYFLQTGISLPLQEPADSQLSPGLQKRYYDQYHEGFQFDFTTGISREQSREFLEMLSFYHQLHPPAYLKEPAAQSRQTVAFSRSIGSELDLSPWFNRPCVIVIGYLEDSEHPLPLLVDGDRPSGRGLTMIRWIHPLPIRPEEAFPVSFPRRERIRRNPRNGE